VASIYEFMLKKNILLKSIFLVFALSIEAHCQDVKLDTVQIHEQKQILKLANYAVDNYAPTSSLSSDATKEVATPFSDFSSLANLTPSFSSTTPNGNGFDAGKNMTLRGFPDGQFNVTLDGIPFADPDTFKHHSTSFFPVGTLDHLQVERSPGDATTLGYSNLGGSINLFTKIIPDQSKTEAYASWGSYGTYLTGAQINTANNKDGSTALLVNIETMKSNGALSLAGAEKNDLLIKTDNRFEDFKLTTLYSLDLYKFYNPPSITTSQLIEFGPGFGFSNQINTPTFFAYNKTTRRSDFGYVDIEGQLDNKWSIKNTLYTYSYASSGLAPSGDSSSSYIGSGFAVNPYDIGGTSTNNSYRTNGDFFKINHRFDKDLNMKLGFWVEQSEQKQNRNSIDLTTGLLYSGNKSLNASTLYDFENKLTTSQSSVDFEYKIAESFYTQAGVKYQQVNRSLNASILPTSLPGTNGNVTKRINSSMPSVSGRYEIEKNSSLYVQWSKGSLTPLLSYFYTKNPAAGNLANPETGTATQLGYIQASDYFNFNVDAYQVRLDNYISKYTINNNVEYINDGSVLYRGIEFESDIYAGNGFTGIINASLIGAKFLNDGVTSVNQHAGDRISFAPSYLGLWGLLYSNEGWNSSLITKYVGSEYQGKNGSSDGAPFYVRPYSYTNITISKLIRSIYDKNNATLSFQVSNLFNRNSITDTAGPSILGPLLVNVLPARSYTLSLRVEL